MDTYTLTAESRTPGKGATHALRRENKVPCEIYGHGVSNVSFQVDELPLNKLIYTNQLHKVTVALDGQTWDCVLKHVDFHPVTDRPIHADFQVLQETEKIKITVPIKFSGTALGQVNGGDITYVLHELTVVCLPQDLVSQLEVDVTPLKIGQSLQVGDLSFSGIEILGDSRRSVVFVKVPREDIIEDEEEEDELVLEEVEEEG